MRSLLTFVLCLCVGAVFAQLQVVAPNGDVGIGTATPSGKLHVNLPSGDLIINAQTGTAVGRIFVNSTQNSGFNFAIGGVKKWSPAGFAGGGDGANTDFVFYNEQTQKLSLFIDGDSDQARFAGSVTAQGVLLTSDARLKRDIKPYDKGLSTIMRIKPVSFKYSRDKNSRKYVGVLAQDLQKIDSDLVTVQKEDEIDENMQLTGKSNDYLAIQSDAIQYLLINAIQDQQEIIQKLEARIKVLEQK